MILFNTTFVYDRNLRGQLCEWIREVWLTEALRSGMELPLCAHVPVAQDEALSMAVQGRFEIDADAEAWYSSRGAELLEALHGKFGERVLAFSTLMEVFQP